MSLSHARIDRSNRPKTDFSVDDVLFRMTPGAIDPVARYYVERVLAPDTYRVQIFDNDGELLSKSIVITPERAGHYHIDPVATNLMAKLRGLSGENETLI